MQKSLVVDQISATGGSIHKLINPCVYWIYSFTSCLIKSIMLLISQANRRKISMPIPGQNVTTEVLQMQITRTE